MSKTERLALDSCIKCSICVSHCPVARVTDKFAGPKQNGPDLERFRLEEPTAIHPSVGYCTNCKNCDVACPSGVSISTMNTKAKGEYVKQNGAPLRDQLLARVALMGKASRLAPSIVNRLGKVKFLRALGQTFFGVSQDMILPQYAKKTFLQLYKPSKQAGAKRKVLYYPGCYVNYNTPEVGLALVEVFNHNGIEVAVDVFECCGLPIMANGLLDLAEVHARKNIAKLEQYIQQGYVVVTTCPSCNLTLRQEYQELFGMDTKLINANIFDAFEYLNELNQQGELKTDFQEVPSTLGYHQPCHLKSAGCGIPSLQTLRLIPGLKAIDLDAGCCGLSGSYGFKKEKYPISQEIGQNIKRAVEELGVQEVTSECGMCQLQIAHVTGAQVHHPLQILAKAYGLGH